jgi:hypothetical protein
MVVSDIAITIAVGNADLVAGLLGLRICQIPAVQRLQKHQDPTGGRRKIRAMT